MKYHVGDWLDYNNLRAPDVADAITEGNISFLIRSFLEEEGFSTSSCVDEVLGSQDSSLQTYVVPALATLIGDVGKVTELVARIEFARPTGNEELPHTEDFGHARPPVITMEWTGSADDLICLAHEVAHALQFMMSDHELMPPVAREVCAFLGELALITYCREHAPSLISALSDVWHAENERYLGSDLDALSDACLMLIVAPAV